MKPVSIICLILIFLLAGAGCEKPRLPLERGAPGNEGVEKLSFYSYYAPVKIDILPLTEFIFVNDIDRSGINLYVSLLDQYGSQVKSPGTFRFELYEYVQHSGQQRGKRIKMWQDLDLNDPAANNEQWRDYLRAYEFNLPLDQSGTGDFILEVTCLCPNGRRLLSEYTLRYSEQP